jgi:hypothetical protein
MAQDPKSIKVQGVTVEVSQPYAEGHKITEAEARSLNQTRAENIANNKRKQIKDMLDAEGATEESVQSAAQALITEYDKEYEFTLASVGGGSVSKLDPVTKEARVIARNWIAGKLKEQGITQKAYLEANGDDAIKNKIAELAENEQIVKLAKENIKKRESLASIEM